MNQFDISSNEDTKSERVTLTLDKKTLKQFQQFQKTQQKENDEKEPKNIIPVLMNKFIQWLKVPKNPIIQTKLDFIYSIKKGRQYMCIKDLRVLCEDEIIKQYWIHFLQDFAIKSIKVMRANANKTLYEQNLQRLLKEAKNPRTRDQPYKYFNSKFKDNTSDDQQEVSESNQDYYSIDCEFYSQQQFFKI